MSLIPNISIPQRKDVERARVRELAFVWVCFQNRKRKEENRAEEKKESMKTKSAESGVRCGSELEAEGGKGEGRGLRGVLISNCAWCCVITPAKA